MSDSSGDPRKELLRRWNTEQDFSKRNEILAQMSDLKLFPSGEERSLEVEAGLYPDLPDPHAKLYNSQFIQKLLQKQEFREDKQEGIASLLDSGQSLMDLLESDASACGAYKKGSDSKTNSADVTPFELSPTQRFIGRFLSPQTPYNSALLFHGVGVGKTCSGVTVAENFLEMFPRKQVYIIAPPTIQAGWLREIFNMRKLVLGSKPGMPNTHIGCTGNTYLMLASVEYERDVAVIKKKIGEIIKSRYKIMGYLQFYNYVIKYLNRNISKELSEENRRKERRKYLDKKFSGNLLIVDEAHNLRDTETEVVEVKEVKEAPPPPPAKEAPPPSPRANAKSRKPENVGSSASNTKEEDEEDEEEEVTLTTARVVAKPNGLEEDEEEEDEEEVTLTTARVVAKPNALEEEEEEEDESAVNVQGETFSEDEDENEEEEESGVKVQGENVVYEGGSNADDINIKLGDDEDEEEVNLQPVTKKEEFAGEDKDTQVAPEDKQDILKGKRVTPLLREIFSIADGMKLLMLTATPMYNDYKEIIGLLNFLLLNDKRAQLTFPQVFSSEPGQFFAPGGKELLGRVASSYVSFMRGENPLSFPIRLNPDLANLSPAAKEFFYPIETWPSNQPDGSAISSEERIQVKNLPYVACQMNPDIVDDFMKYSRALIEKEKLTIPTTDKLIMAGNFLYPAESENYADKVGKKGFDASFIRYPKPTRFKPTAEAGAEWMASEYDESEPLLYHSPKAKFLVDRLATTKGVAFVYSRFVETGALTLALILEANGYTCASRKNALLDLDEKIDAKGRQCALCPLRENFHKDQTHEFVPAQYVLLTGEKDYSPNNKAAIELATEPANYDGRKVKVVLGSTIASEGIDLKCIREIFVFDSWYHLSKLEQVIGRGIRYKSHCLLPPLDRNCTINLLVLSYGIQSTRETIDMYQYRRGYVKAKQVGQVTRVLKENALDCNLNKELILIQGLGTIQQVDGQGVTRPDVSVNDSPYTNICDWLETCDYKCKPEVDFKTLDVDYSTYDEYAAKWRASQIKQVLRAIFQEQPWRHFDDLQNRILAEVPRVAKAAILDDIVGNPSFRIRVGDQEGYIIYKNGYYLFQPELLWDKYLPISLRIKNFPVKRDDYEPPEIPIEKPKVAAVEAAKANEEKPLDKGLSQMRAFWDLSVEWARSIAAGKAGLATPTKLNDLLQSRYNHLGSKTVDAISYTFEMIGKLYTSIKANEPLRKKFAAVVLEFVWDEYLTAGEIQKLYSLNPESDEIKIAARENMYQYGKTLAFRYVDPTSNKLQYICDGKPCPPSIIDGIEAEDPLSSLKANKTTTGLLYGLNIGKEGKILFKSNDAVNVDEKPTTGRLCYSVANMKDKYAMLDKISKIALTIPEIASDLDLSLAKVENKIKTPARVCTLADLALRLFDKIRPNSLRYFYRPISAIKTGHQQK